MTGAEDTELYFKSKGVYSCYSGYITGTAQNFCSETPDLRSVIVLLTWSQSIIASSIAAPVGHGLWPLPSLTRASYNQKFLTRFPFFPKQLSGLMNHAAHNVPPSSMDLQHSCWRCCHAQRLMLIISHMSIRLEQMEARHGLTELAWR